MRKKVLLGVAPLLLLACVVFAAVPSVADAISDVLTVYNPSHVVGYTVVALDSQEGSGNTLFYLAVPGFSTGSLIGKSTTLCETLPCNAGSPVSNFSDIVGDFAVPGVGPRLGFFSGDNGTPFGSAGAFFVLEQSGVPLDITKYLDPGKARAGWTATFVSYEEPVTIPEPGTLALLGSGLIGLAGFARRKSN